MDGLYKSQKIIDNLVFTCYMITPRSHNEARYDSHRHQFLNEQFHAVGDAHLCNVGAVLAVAASINAALRVGYTKDAALAAHMHAEEVAAIAHAFFDEGRRAVAYDCVTFHLAETEATVTCAAFGRLPC